MRRGRHRSTTSHRDAPRRIHALDTPLQRRECRGEGGSGVEGEIAMQRSIPYVMHAIDGRVRIKLPAVRGSAAMAGAVTARLRAIDGVDGVHANPITGSVVV